MRAVTFLHVLWSYTRIAVFEGPERSLPLQMWMWATCLLPLPSLRLGWYSTPLIQQKDQLRYVMCETMSSVITKQSLTLLSTILPFIPEFIQPSLKCMCGSCQFIRHHSKFLNAHILGHRTWARAEGSLFNWLLLLSVCTLEIPSCCSFSVWGHQLLGLGMNSSS